MMRRGLTVLITACLLAACGKEAPQQTTVSPSYNVDTGRITVSGLSAGAYMAGQLHVAHSELFSGAALLAGGPYWCAQGSIKRGLGPCIEGGDVSLEALLDYARGAEAAAAVDALDNLADDSVWVFHGAGDDVVSAEVPAAAAAFYRALAADINIVQISDVPAVHGIPTLATGAPCDQMVAPFVNACNYDAAGEALQALHGELSPRGVASGRLEVIAQPGADDATMLDRAFLYVPAACADGEACGLHVALHGCQQSSEKIGDAFAAGAGFNEWAETNRLLVLYPVASSRIAPLNPLGCWDWWGYTGEEYATKSAKQIAVIKAMMDSIAGKTL